MLFPKLYYKSICDITPQILSDIGIKGVILDVDNTVLTYKSDIIAPEIVNAVDILKNADIKIALLSNNFNSRVMACAKSLSLPYVSFGIKPLPFGFLKAKKLLGLKKNEVTVIGDQVYTDILGANFLKMFSILLEPLDKRSEGPTQRLRRLFEMPIVKRCEKNGYNDKFRG